MKDLKKENYRPVSILSNLSKIFEKCIYKQLSIFFENKFSKYQCGFRKNHSAQHSLIAMLENWRACVDQGLAFGALLTFLRLLIVFRMTYLLLKSMLLGSI